MRIRVSVSALADGSTPEALFDRVADPAAASEFFRGFGPIPAIDEVRVRTAGPPQVGTRRDVLLADGSVLSEEIVEFDRPTRHRYRIVDLRPPLARLMSEAGGDWHFSPEPNGARVTWTYYYRARSAWIWPVSMLFAHVLMRTAMRRAARRLTQQGARGSIVAPHSTH